MNSCCSVFLLVILFCTLDNSFMLILSRCVILLQFTLLFISVIRLLRYHSGARCVISYTCVTASSSSFSRALCLPRASCYCLQHAIYRELLYRTCRRAVFRPASFACHLNILVLLYLLNVHFSTTTAHFCATVLFAVLFLFAPATTYLYIC